MKQVPLGLNVVYTRFWFDVML